MHRENEHRGEIMQFAEEYTARRLNAYAEVERARDLERRRVITERTALAHEQRVAAKTARRRLEAVSEPVADVVPETVTVETILRSAPRLAAGVTDASEPAVRGGSEAREELQPAAR
jgi:phage terminase Nu1 subunit (DNA packaging protein)